MVVKEAGSHFTPIMKKLNELRKDEIIYDVRVVFGDKEIPAHKCILVASSDYFRSLFLGPVKTDSDRVDLSSVAIDFASVEAVIDFLYTGKINIEDENLEALLKLSQFLLLKEIEDMCKCYMKECNSLEPFLSYYILSEDYMLDEDTRDYFAKTLQIRFHDFFIFKEATKQINVFHLKQLMKTYQIFQHCEACDILSFVVDWLLNGNTDMTEEYEQLGIEILEIIEQRINLYDKEQYQHTFEQLHEKFGASEIYPKVKERLSQIFEKNLAGKFESEQIDGAEKGAENLENEIEQCDVEDVVIAFIPKKRLKEFLNSTVRSKTCEGVDALFDLCVYVPKQKKWYNLTEGPNNSVFKHIGKRNYDISRSGYMFTGSLKEKFESDWTLNCCTLDFICCTSPSEGTIHIFHLKHHLWESFSYQHLVSNFPEFDPASDVRLCCKNGEQLVLILRKRVASMNDSDYNISFKCYTRGTQTQAFWSLMFQTPFMHHTEETKLNGGKFGVCLSHDGEQMYIVNSGDWIQVFVVNLETLALEVKLLHVDNKYMYDEYDDIAADRVWLLQNEEQVHFIEERHYDGDTGIYFRSRQVNKPDSIKYDNFDEIMVETSYPDEHNPNVSFEKIVCISSDGKFLWLVSGDGKFGSSIDTVSVDRDERIQEIQHTPPPFSAITTVAAGTVRSEHLAQLQPIKHFLQD